MKIIFDFDDVLFNNTAKFKEHMFSCIEHAGIPRELAVNEYQKVRNTYVPFSLKNFIGYLSREKNIGLDHIQELYTEILGEVNKTFLNKDLIEIAKQAGKENCFLVTNGDEEFQKAKIAATDVAYLFKDIYYVTQSKKEIIEKICSENSTDTLLFIEDRTRFIEDLDMTKCPNLTVILYDDQGLEKVRAALK